MEETMDIQRGDFVYIHPSGPESGRIPAEVTGISGNGPEVTLEVRYTLSDGSTVNESIPISKCTPIPITEDCYINGHQDAVDDILKWFGEVIAGQFRSISDSDKVRLVRDLKKKFKVDLE